jgi:hypothetical protein
MQKNHDLDQFSFPALSRFIRENCQSCGKDCGIPSPDAFACMFKKLSEKNSSKVVPDCLLIHNGAVKDSKKTTKETGILNTDQTQKEYPLDIEDEEKTVIERVVPTSNTIKNTASKKDGEITSSSKTYNTEQIGKVASIIGAHSEPKEHSRLCKKKNQKGYFKEPWKNINDKQRSFLQIDDPKGGCKL